MLHDVSGDILLTKAQAVAHGIAPNDLFDRGLALALREKWPTLATDFRRYANQCQPKPGEIWAWEGFHARVFCLMTQDGSHVNGATPGRASIVNVNHCLRRLRYELEKGEIQCIALPKLATGIGGLDWTNVRPLIQNHLGGLSIPVFVYSEYRPGLQATQTGL